MSEESENQKEPKYDSSSLRMRSSNSSEQSVSLEINNKNHNTIPPMSSALQQLQITPMVGVEERNKATRKQMQKEWRDSSISYGDLSVPRRMRETGIYKNVYDQYIWYLNQVFEKHSEYFNSRIVEINNRQHKKGTITGECKTLQHVVYVQDDYKHKLTGRRGSVYLGFSKDNVKEHFGLSLESLLLFMEGSQKYLHGRAVYTAGSSKCLIAQLKTRMLSNDNVEYVKLINSKLPSVLSEAVEVISKLTTASDTPKGSTSNTTKWEQSEEYRFDSGMVEKSELVSLFKCIDVYFQWYMKLVSEKHADKFTQRIAEINKASSKVPNGYTITVVDSNVALGLLGFQLHYEDALRNDKVCMGFSEHEVDEQYGITVESLFTFNECARKYTESGITIRGPSSDCIVSDLLTRMKSTEYREYLGNSGDNMVEILYTTLKIVSDLTTLPSKLDVKLQLQMLREAEEDEHDTDKEQEEESMNRVADFIDMQERLELEKMKTYKEWQKTEEYRFDSEMVEKSELVSLFKCIDMYFQWYMTLVSEKHMDKFTQRIAEINKASSKVPNGYTITVVDSNVALGLLGFQLHYKDALRNGKVCMGFSKREVASQYGIPLGSLFTFNECARKYTENGITIRGPVSRCIVSDLITRMKNIEYRTYQSKFNGTMDMVQILYKTLEVVSELTRPDSKLYVKLQEALHTVGRKRNKAARKQMQKEWRDSSISYGDLSVPRRMRETGIYKNVYDQYIWYLDQVFEKHSEYFNARIVEINNRQHKKGTITGECKTLQHVVYVQDDYKHKLTGRRGSVYLGFSKDNVKEHFGLSLEGLLLFMEGSQKYLHGRAVYTAGSSKCLIAQLKTRMLSNDNVEYVKLINSKLPSVLSEAVEVISRLTTTTSDTP